jgi:hypothetical protein
LRRFSTRTAISSRAQTARTASLDFRVAMRVRDEEARCFDDRLLGNLPDTMIEAALDVEAARPAAA